MKDVVIAIDLALISTGIGLLFSIWRVLSGIASIEKNIALNISEIRGDIKFLNQRQDRFDDFMSANSGFIPRK